MHDECLLIEDARLAVKKLDQQGIFSYCISLDPRADEYVGDWRFVFTPIASETRQVAPSPSALLSRSLLRAR